jgi:glycosyltransferase involved in cell wall biosynthesis
MRVLLLTQYYPPEPVFQFADLARGLRARGHEVQVITGFPCYPTSRTYDGFRQRHCDEQWLDGVLVTRIPQFPDHSRSVFRRAMYYLSFALSAATIGLWRARPSDVLLVYQSAFPIGLAAWVISRIRRMPYVLDVVDLWPESVAASGMIRNRLLLSMIRKAMQFIYRRAERINVITQGYWNMLESLGVPAEKLSLIYYWPPMGQFDPAPYDVDLARETGLQGRFNVMYSGAMGPVQDLASVIEAAVLLRDLPEIQFVFVGDGLEHDELMTLAEQRGATNVRFLGRQSPAMMQQLYPLAEALLVHLKPDPVARVSIPSKTFAYMASGRPVLMAVEGEAGRLIEKHRCGISVPPSNPDALAQAVRRLIATPESKRREMARAAREAYCNHYCSATQIPKFEALLQRAAPPVVENQLPRAA